MATILSHSISYHLPAGEALMWRGEPGLGGEVGEGQLALLLIQFLKHESPRPGPNWSISWPSCPLVGSGSGGGVGCTSFHSPTTPCETNTVNVRHGMELSMQHRLSSLINGEMYLLLCSETGDGANAPP